MTDERIEGEIAVVTGGAGGLGRAVANALAARGATVATLDLSPVEDGDPGHYVCDVADSDAVADVADAVLSHYGPVTRLVCAAGVVSEYPLDQLSVSEWHRVVDVSLTGTFLAAQAFAPQMVKAGGGAIVTTSSDWSSKGYPRGSHYAAAKAGVEALTKSLARELAPAGVRVNAISPGPFRTGMLDSLPDFSEEERIATIPLGRIGEVADIVDPMLFLLSDRSRYITGQILHVNGGMLMP